MKQPRSGHGLQAALAILPLVCLSAAAVATGEERLVIHEWGTFTCLRDDNGTQLPGINVDDEQLPPFVHNLRPDMLRPDLLAGARGQPVRQQRQGNSHTAREPQGHSDVTLRLETPVIYFYPPPGHSLPLELDVHVGFRGGWLTEFYPEAEAYASGLKRGAVNFGSLDAGIAGSLDWRRLRVGTIRPGPTTDAPVWNLPRQVQAAGVTAASGESEKYLFYRGVGNFESPLWVERSLATRNALLPDAARRFAARGVSAQPGAAVAGSRPSRRQNRVSRVAGGRGCRKENRGHVSARRGNFPNRNMPIRPPTA